MIPAKTNSVKEIQLVSTTLKIQISKIYMTELKQIFKTFLKTTKKFKTWMNFWTLRSMLPFKLKHVGWYLQNTPLLSIMLHHEVAGLMFPQLDNKAAVSDQQL